jgi:hypothetical protein
MATLNELLISAVVGTVASVVAAEVVAYAPRVSQWLIRKAANNLPQADQSRYAEEWLSHADELPGGIAKLQHALGCWLRASHAIRHFRNRPMWMRHLRAVRMHATFWARLLPTMAKLLLRSDWSDLKPTSAAIFVSIKVARVLTISVVAAMAYHDASAEQALADVTAALEKFSMEAKKRGGAARKK